MQQRNKIILNQTMIAHRNNAEMGTMITRIILTF